MNKHTRFAVLVWLIWCVIVGVIVLYLAGLL